MAMNLFFPSPGSIYQKPTAIDSSALSPNMWPKPLQGQSELSQISIVFVGGVDHLLHVFCLFAWTLEFQLQEVCRM